MNLELLKSFVAVAETGGISKAEDRIHRTQSTISQQIARLESDLSTALFDRSKRTVQLTERGRQYLDYARRILDLDQESRALITDQDRFRIINIGLSDNNSQKDWWSCLRGFATQHKDIRATIKTDISNQLLSQVQEGHLDLTLSNELNEPNGVPDYHPVQLKWIAAKDFDVSAMRPLPLILYRPGCSFRTRAITALESAGIPWRIAFETTDWRSIRKATEEGFGVTLLDSLDGMTDVCELPPGSNLPEVDLIYLTLRLRPGSHNDPVLQDLAKHFRSIIKPQKNQINIQM
ncbi:MAG: LysR family transcriptional regulator [Magnetovibrio sp.]|nr:LysR family transcriptional regulator [Magnetovibrio sp.]